MSTNNRTIPAETARHVLWHYGAEGGYQPGNFTQKLMATIAAADVIHTTRLLTVYPDLVYAMTLAGTREDGIKRLQAVAAGEAAA
ncbi:hypothetical protein ACKI1J_15140 [Streptomyces scabiei]|uniref:hypothetical protein n=1 Tax=Streptomyces scabiei TaxID=1930 RepID=UPI0038F69362